MVRKYLSIMAFVALAFAALGQQRAAAQTPNVGFQVNACVMSANSPLRIYAYGGTTVAGVASGRVAMSGAFSFGGYVKSITVDPNSPSVRYVTTVGLLNNKPATMMLALDSSGAGKFSWSVTSTTSASGVTTSPLEWGYINIW